MVAAESAQARRAPMSSTISVVRTCPRPRPHRRTSHAPSLAAQAYFLQSNADGVNLHDHLAEMLQGLLASKDPNALANFESLSLDVKAGRFNPTLGVKVRRCQQKHNLSVSVPRTARRSRVHATAAARVHVAAANPHMPLTPVADCAAENRGRRGEAAQQRALHR